jgi:hypothetical protein
MTTKLPLLTNYSGTVIKKPRIITVQDKALCPPLVNEIRWNEVRGLRSSLPSFQG